MGLWSSDEVASALSVSVAHSWSATGISIDSRTIEKGEIFFAIIGERFDGHAYVAQAFEKGAVAAVVSQIPDGVDTDKDKLVVVDDVLQALEMLAHASRSRMNGKLVAVTGSVGKTSTKEMLQMVLSGQGKTFCSSGNFNNHIGLPLSMCRMPKDTNYAIFELGMSGPDEIRPLTKIVRPHAALITTVEPVHLEFFDSIEGIAYAKSEIFEGLESGGVAIVNRDNAYHEIMINQASEYADQIVTFGTSDACSAILETVDESDQNSHIVANFKGAALNYKLGLLGSHQAMNSLAVLLAVDAIGADVQEAAQKLKSFHAQAGRGQIHHIDRKDGLITLIDDTYNASPASITASIENVAKLAKQQHAKTIIVLGDMFELGPEAPRMHEELSSVIEQHHIDMVLTAGDLMAHLHEKLPAAKKGNHYKNSTELAETIQDYVNGQCICMVKGSRGMKMEHVVQSLLKLNP